MCCVYCSRGMDWRARSKIKDKFIWKCENKQSLKFKTILLIRNDSFSEKNTN
ncbi:hypothetical protein AAJ76_790002878 [Vairimorpha ceranae]|uniref:Uncharacterized protein n=1 Tax=Vairimorpha ceranae TaxID=40302 RepID=A0A0F9YNW9_9MICR|nr:hypothetical protein AAJ76_790002878 [Vairimorpha ceranae]KKO74362.1 hypothetical protein AAJ76_790002878 [Vairimorpha ceranae]